MMKTVKSCVAQPDRKREVTKQAIKYTFSKKKEKKEGGQLDHADDENRTHQ